MKKLNITAEDVAVYRKDKVSQAGNPYTRYSTKLSKQQEGGEWIDKFYQLAFKKGVDIPHKSKINIKKAFIALDKYNDTVTDTWFVMDYEMVTEGEKPVANDDFMNVPDSDLEELPFK